jgi:hypothetical protein
MRPHRGTSRSYLIAKLRQAGEHELVAAIEGGEISARAIVIALGWRRRGPILGTGSTNATKRREQRLRALGL